MNETRECSSCHVTKPLTEFYARSGRCKTCAKQYQRDYAAKRRADPARQEAYLQYQKDYQGSWGRQHRAERFVWLDEIKAKPCLDCGRSFPPECMDFDHRDPATKLFSVSQAAVGGRSIESVKAEVAKCDLVCACCHRIRTAKQQGFRRP